MASARALGGAIPTSRTSYIGKGRGRGKLAPPKNDGPQQPGRQQVAAADEPLTGVGILKGHWTSVTSSPTFSKKKLRFLYH